MSIRKIHKYRVTCDYGLDGVCWGEREVSGTSTWDATKELREVFGWQITTETRTFRLEVACPVCVIEIAKKGVALSPEGDVAVLTSDNAPGS